MSKIQLSEKGLTDENLTFVKELNKKFAELPEMVDKGEMLTEVKLLLKGAFNEKGEALDFTKLRELAGDDDKGITAILEKQTNILKKQGEELTALKMMGGAVKEITFKDSLKEKMGELELMSKSREGAVILSLKAPAVMALSNTITGDNLLPDTLIESFSISAFVPKRQPREYVFDIASRRTVANISEFKTWLEEGNEQGAFAIVAEGAVKPLVSYSLVRNSSQVRKVAAKYVVTEEFAKFRPEAYAIIQRLINQKILRDYAAILTTDLIADAAPYVGSALDDQYPAAKVTDYHAIAAVAAQIEALNFMPDVLIMNPQDKWRIGMLSNADGTFYLTIPFTSPNGETKLMGFNVRTSTRIPVGNFILGESQLWEIEEEALTIRMGYGIDVTTVGGNVTAVVGDFDTNKFRVIVETFFHNFIGTNNIGSFVYANFAAVKAAVTL